MNFLRAGGFGMWLVLATGAATLVTAILFARKPDERRMSLMRGLTWATIFSVLTAVSSNVAAVMFKVPTNPEWSHSPDLHLIVMTGLGESLTPAIVGFAFLTLTWIVASVGMRRLADRLSQVTAAAVATP
ncbi:MAG: hypothetical protein JRI55_19545 [Deltaproteobacteria bacterium]|nr:hypothetical protein [Deltaproteobacteria bacterium]